VARLRALLLADRIEVKRQDSVLKYASKPEGATVFVEIARRSDGSPSGVMTSEAETTAWHIGAHDMPDGSVEGGVVVLVRTDRLREYCVAQVDSHSPNVRTFPQVGVLVPWVDILKLC
jgi:hypothetical protein